MTCLKAKYEDIIVEIIPLLSDDVITTSKPFDGEDDEIGSDWN